MGLKNKMVVETSDGQWFNSKSEAVKHEYELQRTKMIDAFVRSGPGADYSDRGKASARRILGNFSDWMRDRPDKLGEAEPMPWDAGESAKIVSPAIQWFPFVDDAKALAKAGPQDPQPVDQPVDQPEAPEAPEAPELEDDQEETPELLV